MLNKKKMMPPHAHAAQLVASEEQRRRFEALEARVAHLEEEMRTSIFTIVRRLERSSRRIDELQRQLATLTVPSPPPQQPSAASSSGARQSSSSAGRQ